MMERQASQLSSTVDDLSTSSPETLSRSQTSKTCAKPPKNSNDKLNFYSLGMYGRDHQLSVLNGCFDQLLTGNIERQLLLISGTSGSGKSKLANTLKKPTSNCNGLFVRGKFDIACRSEPYSGLANACAEICNAILELQTHNRIHATMICQHLKEELGAELDLLIQVIPVLNKVFHEHELVRQESQGNTVAQKTSSSSLDSKNRFFFAFLRFMRVISNEFDPLVIVIDDIQWADPCSLELMEAIVADRSNPKLLLVGTYRSNEVDPTHVFHQTLIDLRAKSKDHDFALTEMEVGNLGLQDVHNIVHHLLQCESKERTEGLAQVCFDKTHGNVFFLLQFMSMLYDNKMLQFGVKGFSWSWDEDEIKASTHASDNVVDILKANIAGLERKELIDILKLAAFLGATFELETLNLVWRHISSTKVQEGKYDDSLVSGLRVLQKEGFLVKPSRDGSNYTWAHDKVQEAAMAMVPDSEQTSFGRRVGEILVSELGETEELDSCMFVAVSLLNVESMEEKMTKEERLKLAHLNARASNKAISMSAFESASGYAAHGIRYLPENSWNTHYELTLQLYSCGAKADAFLGNVEVMERYCKEVMAQQDKPVEDKFDVYNSWIDSISNRCLNEEAIELILKILAQFKCRFPTSKVGIGFEMLVNVMHIKATMKSRDATKLNRMEDQTRVELMKLLDKLATCLYMVGDDRMPLSVFRCLNWSIKHGHCAYSCVSFATTGMMLTGILDDLQGGSKYGEQALVLLGKTTSTVTASRTMFCVYSFLFPWTKPLKDLLKPLLQAYHVGLQSGDTESATWAVQNWLVLKYLMGSSLNSMEQAALMYGKQMKDLKRDQAFYFCKCMRQMYLNLMGRNNEDDPTSLVGDSMTKEDLEHCENSTPVLRGAVHTYYSFLLTAYGDHVRHADLAIELGHDYLIKTIVGASSNMRDVFLKGVSCFAAAQQTGKKKYLKIAQLLRAKIQRWQDMGNPTVKHYKSLLDAEAMAIKGKKVSRDVIELYEIAIAQSSRGGYRHDAALASERLGEYFLIFQSTHQREAEKQFQRAQKYWKSWGAMGKVYHLQDKYSDLVPPPTEVQLKQN